MGSPITLSGFNSIDFNLILNTIMQQERQPVVALEAQKKSLDAQKSTFGSLASKLGALESAVERWPELQEAHYQLAVVAFAHQDLAHAVTEWDRAAELDPDSELGRSAAQFVTLLAADEAPTTPAP